MEPADLTIAAAADAIRSGRLSPVELAEACLRRIECLNPRLNAYVTVTAERARADARRAGEELAAGRWRGPLHGIPIGVKDLYDTAGIRTAAGSKVHAGRVPATDATVVRRLRDAGAVLLGKENTHEYAWGITTDNPHWGPTRNPWDTTRIPGGSSGGSAAAVAACLSLGSMGSDTGGSIRLPAALCGVVGLKPTHGRVSTVGLFPMSHLFDHAGPLARTVEDAAILLGAVAGYDPADWASVPVPVADYRARLAGGIRGLRIGVPRTGFFLALDAEVRSGVEAAMGVLRDLGASVADVEVPELPPSLIDILISEGRSIHADTLAQRPDDLGADLRAVFSSPPIDGSQLARAVHDTCTYAAQIRLLLETVDLLVAPTVPVAAPRIGQETVAVGPVELPIFFGISACTPQFNVARVPALTVPCGFTAAGLPIGLQLAGRPFDEATVLAAGHAYEQATAWHARRPPCIDAAGGAG